MTPRLHKLGYYSSPDRGLIYCLDMWPQILEAFPDAELHIFYGFETFDSAFNSNPERMAWKAKMMEKMKQKGIVYHGRVGKNTLREWQRNIGIWFYPTNFTEIHCICALDCQSQGCVPVTMTLAALDETVQSGVKLSCDIEDEDCQKEYVKELLALMGDEERWKVEQEKGKKFTEGLSWSKVAEQWPV